MVDRTRRRHVLDYRGAHVHFSACTEYDMTMRPLPSPDRIAHPSHRDTNPRWRFRILVLHVFPVESSQVTSVGSLEHRWYLEILDRRSAS